ncbi:hypothetical protein MBAV_004400 [Candidatus Magnetobacterium bavaricum]|uniref:Uncharacterized protein n=1 Tax=Candidatus Magnetobacterium bavaricum TaxID=29290 RepID=A0A0F3GNM2_9BACT|nr:hypothetical protein MBAV_004400 [Candidatus Magnetobacterium bavaricum]
MLRNETNQINPKIKRPTHVSPDLLKRIQDGAKTSKAFPLKYRKLLISTCP